MALAHVSDAFTVLPVAKAELQHTLAPSTKEDEILVFQALLFKYKRCCSSIEWHHCSIAGSQR